MDIGECGRVNDRPPPADYFSSAVHLIDILLSSLLQGVSSSAFPNLLFPPIRLLLNRTFSRLFVDNIGEYHIR